MADIVARLKLDNKDYEDKLAKAKKSTKKFSQDGGSGVSDMMGKFKALGAAVAASKVAMETFNAVISSSQTIGDAYTRAMEGAKGAVNEFVYSISNADFSGFNGGLKDIIANAKEAASAMDSLGNAQISYDYLTAGYKASFKENMGKAKDKSLSIEDRQAAYDAAMEDLGKIDEAVQVYTSKVTDAVVANAKAKGNNINKDFITRENIDRIYALDLSANGEAEKKALAERYEQFKKISKELKEQEGLERGYRANLVAGNYMVKDRDKFTEKMNEASAKAAELRAQLNTEDMQMSALYNAMLVKGTDEWLKGLADLVVKADNAKEQYESMRASTLKVRDNISNAANEQMKLTQAAKEYAQSFGMGFYENLGGGQSFGQKRENAYDQATGTYNATIHEDVPIIDTTDWTEEALPTISAATTDLESMTETTYDAADAMGALSSTMRSLSSVVGEGAAGWLEWGAGVVDAISAAIPQIAALTTAKKGEATANAESAATGAASSVASIPYVGPIMAVAAVASVLAALANLPEFAHGGVVPGTSFTGDNVLIRANSGERVLTREQSTAWERNMRGGLNGKVTFEIKGQRLVGVLNNYNSVSGMRYGG